jgi:adenylate cyclase
VNNLIRHEALVELSWLADGLIALAFAALTALAAIMLAPIGAVLVYLGIAAAWTAGAIAVFTHALALPLVAPILAGLAALVATIGYRSPLARSPRQ